MIKLKYVLISNLMLISLMLWAGGWLSASTKPMEEGWLAYGCIGSGESQPKLCGFDIFTILANRDFFEGRMIATSGYLTNESGHFYLYPSKDMAIHRFIPAQIEITKKSGFEFNEAKESEVIYVELAGTLTYCEGLLHAPCTLKISETYKISRPIEFN